MNNILVVGADRGIANAICKQLHARGEHVIAACMGEGECFGEGGVDTIGGIDVTSDAAVRKLVQGLHARNARLDWVLHVAGVAAESRAMGRNLVAPMFRGSTGQNRQRGRRP